MQADCREEASVCVCIHQDDAAVLAVVFLGLSAPSYF